VAKYEVFRGSTLVGSPTGTSFTDTGLSASTAYSYTVKATDAAGNVSAASTAVTGTTSTAGGDTIPPSAPTGVTVSGTTSSSVSLSWTASTDNVGVTGYQVFRGNTLVGSPATTSFTDTGLNASTAYSYTVKAVDAAGNVSAASSSVSATTASGGGGTVTDCTPQGTTSLQGGEYIYQQNEWNSTLQQCATINPSTGAWSLSTATFNTSGGAPATYPSSFKGCHWGLCSTNSGLPIQVSKLGTVTSSWSTTQVPSGAYDVAYDIWFNSTPTTTGQPDGTEMMIWINHMGGIQPFGSQTGTANLAGSNWNVWTGQQTSWKIVSYVLQTGTTSVSNLNIKALIDDAVSRGSLNSAHYLIDSEVGFEVWSGGQGLGTNSYSFSATAGSGGDTQAPSAPSGLTVSGTTSSSVSLSWTAATDNVGVTGYQVFRGSTLVGSPTSTSFTDTGLNASTAYSYSVKAVDAAGNVSAASTAVSATTAAGSTGGSGCAASFHNDNDWGSGFNATITVTNTGTAATKGWKVTWTWGGNQQIVNSWNATLTSSGSSVTATNLGYNGAIAAGGNTSFGLQANYTGTNTAPTLTCTTS
jgi:chitodextrinase